MDRSVLACAATVAVLELGRCVNESMCSSMFWCSDTTGVNTLNTNALSTDIWGHWDMAGGGVGTWQVHECVCPTAMWCYWDDTLGISVVLVRVSNPAQNIMTKK